MPHVLRKLDQWILRVLPYSLSKKSKEVSGITYITGCCFRNFFFQKIYQNEDCVTLFIFRNCNFLENLFIATSWQILSQYFLKPQMQPLTFVVLNCHIPIAIYSYMSEILFRNFTRIYLWWTHFLVKLQVYVSNFTKIDFIVGIFLWIFAIFFRKSFLQVIVKGLVLSQSAFTYSKLTLNM